MILRKRIAVALLTAFMGGCDGEERPVAPSRGQSLEIMSVEFVPAEVPRGGVAQITIRALDPEGGSVSCRLVAQHGTLQPDTADGCQATYRHDGSAGSDRVSVAVVNGQGLTATREVDVRLTPAMPSPTPRPTHSPSPAPLPSSPPARPRLELSSSGDCHPPCVVAFVAKASGGAKVEWGGCASGAGAAASCALNGLESVTATCTARGPGGASTASASARGVNAPPRLAFGSPQTFLANQDWQTTFRVEDDDPGRTGQCSQFQFDLGPVISCRYWRSENVFLMRVYTGDPGQAGFLRWRFTDKWGAAVDGRMRVVVR